MDPKIRELYKRFAFIAKDYPAGKANMMAKVKKAFFTNAHLQNDVEIKKAIAKGRYYAREIVAINQLHKYRHLKKSYYDT